MKSKNNCFNCKITQNDIQLHDQDYQTLKDLADDIGLSYHIVADLHSGRRKENKRQQFKYQPKIEISRIEKS
tara:strand:+ start:218 stop:433 length:216 start_codon:yes stop_codon:yes gene_type:complete